MWAENFGDHIWTIFVAGKLNRETHGDLTASLGETLDLLVRTKIVELNTAPRFSRGAKSKTGPST